MKLIDSLSENKLRTPAYWTLCIFAFIGNTQIFLFSLGFSMVEIESLVKDAPTALSPLLILVSLSVIPGDIKDFIAYFKIRNPLPGTEAFSRWAKSDSRISLERVRSKIGRSLPQKQSSTQNTLWYNLYKPVKFDPSVLDSNKKHVLMRDLAILQFLWLVTLTTMILYHNKNLISLWPSILAYTLLVLATRNTGVRLVQNVLATI